MKIKFILIAVLLAVVLSSCSVRYKNCWYTLNEQTRAVTRQCYKNFMPLHPPK